MYIPLHGHSTYSFLEALWPTKQIVDKAKEIWLTAIAITDYKGIYCYPSFYLAAKEAEIKPIIGVELAFVQEIQNKLPIKKIGNICLIALNNQWYQNLRDIITVANEIGLEWTAKIDFETLEKYHEGLVCFYGGIESRCSVILNDNGDEEKIRDWHQRLQKIFGANLYLEMTAQDENMHEYEKINRFLYKLSQQTNTPCIINNNYFYPKEELKYTREIALSIKDGTKMFDPWRRSPKGKFHIMEEKEIREICLENGYKEEEIQQRLDNNAKIAEQANVEIDFGQALFPVYETPEHVQNLYDQFASWAIIPDEDCWWIEKVSQEDKAMIEKYLPQKKG